MAGAPESRDKIERMFLQLHRQVSLLKQQLQKQEKKVQDLDTQISRIQLTRKLVKQAQDNQPKLDNEVVELERMLARVEALAATENSRNNSTPEVRAINQEIENVLDKVHRLERKVGQSKMDCGLLEHEIEIIKSEFDQTKRAASERLNQLYSKIKEIRQDISRTRKTKLEGFFESQDKLARAEIENQKLNTNAMLFKQLVESVKLELEYIGKPDGADVMEKERAKIEETIRQIPNHAEDRAKLSEERQRTESACQKLLLDVHGLEDEIRNSIEKMSKAENDQDELARQLQECNDANADLRSSLDMNEAILSDLEKTRDRLRMEETTDAAAEMRKLAEAKQKMQQRIDAAKKRLSDFKGDASNCPISMVDLVAKMDSETEKVTRKIRELENQNAALRDSGANWGAN